ncbi:hypothetical protein Tsp_14185, partial [Trichinella spiralis]|uniref:hypothetical protein n=1 Tax=Trichinella spiralis TaxID=6334 RepID=UPI0001EFE619
IRLFYRQRFAGRLMFGAWKPTKQFIQFFFHQYAVSVGTRLELLINPELFTAGDVRRALEQQPMKFYCQKVGRVRGEIGTRPCKSTTFFVVPRVGKTRERFTCL